MTMPHIVKNPVPVWNRIQRYNPQKMPSNRKTVSLLIVDETQIKADSELLWLWIAIEPKSQAALCTKISKERNMFVAQRFLLDMVEEYGNIQHNRRRQCLGNRKHVCVLETWPPY
jgi:putative transposase